MSIKIQVNLPPAEILARLGSNIANRLSRAVGRAMVKHGKTLKMALQNNVKQSLNVKKQTFLNTFKTRLLDQDKTRFPGLRVWNKLRWIGVHEYGGSISGKMLIPLYGRLGDKRFKAVIKELINSGNAHFIKGKSGNVVLMAENIRENASTLAGFKKRYRQAEGIKRLKNSSEIPIAVLVPRVRIPKRLNLNGIVKRLMPTLTGQISAEFRGDHS